MSEEFSLRIDSIAAGGDGVGRHNGMVVFVPRTAPGDVARVTARLDGRLMRGSLASLERPSAERTDPPCAHYVTDCCGGCQLQHIQYDAQLAAKAGIIADSLTRIGRREVKAPDVVRSDAQWRYRSKLTLAIRKRGNSTVAGLRRFDAPDEIFDLRDCPITDERVVSAWKEILGHRDHLPASNELRAAVRLLQHGFSFTVQGGERWESSEQLFNALPALAELWWEPEGQRLRLLHSRSEEERAGAAFVQINPGVASRLLDRILNVADNIRPRTAIDAYAGAGDLAVRLSARGVRVTAIEIDKNASRVCAARLPKSSRAVAAPVERALPDALPSDFVVLNPPRAGLHQRVTDILESQRQKPKAIVYVSCNPATLARDVKRLPSFQIRSLQGFDMFPQTAHVETVCELVPAA